MAAIAQVTAAGAFTALPFRGTSACSFENRRLQSLVVGKRPRGRACSSRRVPSSLRVTSKMIVPGFGDKSPEAKSAESLHNFFTYIAVRVVLSQLQAYNREGYAELREFTERVPLKDGDEFCATLMREGPRYKQLAMRVLEVRQAYALEDFEWDNLQSVTFKRMKEGNTRLMRDFLMETSKFD